MAAPVTNQNYTQQINQAFDMLKYATPQQMQVVSQQVQQNPNSPEAMALAMAAQYQQQARAPRPQAPQGTILQQKLQEFQQTSPQGLPQVGQNQMAMQQAAQKNPMFGAGLAVAPENTEQAPAPQQMAATGGITALAHGGEARRFYDGKLAEVEGGSLDALTDNVAISEEDDIANEGKWFDNFAKQAKSTGTDLLDKYKSMTAPKGVASAGLPSINLGGDPSSPTGAYKAPTLDTAISDMGVPTTGGTSPKIKSTLSDFETAPKTKPKVKAHHSKKDSAPAPGSSAEAIAASPTAKGETYQSLNKYLSKGEANPSSYDADSVVSNMLNSDTTPMLNQDEASIARIQKLLGSEADMSEEVGMAREAAANASRDKGLGALVGGIGGMLSAETPYMGQAVGAGMLAGLSSYQQGAKEQGTADKELMALQMAQKKAKLAPRRAATEMYLGAQTKAAEKAAEAHARMQDIQDKAMYEGKNNLSLEQVKGANSMQKARFEASQAQATKAMDLLSARQLKEYEAGTLSAKSIADVYARAVQGGADPEEAQETVNYLMATMSKTNSGGGSGGGGFGQPIKNGMYIK